MCENSQPFQPFLGLIIFLILSYSNLFHFKNSGRSWLLSFIWYIYSYIVEPKERKGPKLMILNILLNKNKNALKIL